MLSFHSYLPRKNVQKYDIRMLFLASRPWPSKVSKAIIGLNALNNVKKYTQRHIFYESCIKHVLGPVCYHNLTYTCKTLRTAAILDCSWIQVYTSLRKTGFPLLDSGGVFHVNYSTTTKHISIEKALFTFFSNLGHSLTGLIG